MSGGVFLLLLEQGISHGDVVLASQDLVRLVRVFVEIIVVGVNELVLLCLLVLRLLMLRLLVVGLLVLRLFVLRLMFRDGLGLGILLV